MARTSKDKTISIRLSQAMLEALDARAVLDEKDRAQVIREAIAKHLAINDEDEIETKLGFLERSVNQLQGEYQQDRKKTKALEKRIDEITRLVSYCLERLPPGKT
ncbi:MAG: ribbon-helix-helix protein, CopG family [Microcoleaceae cyanobacterium]